eukprot:scaffold25181_cov75-Skeletonema_marinoi.AAC.1
MQQPTNHNTTPHQPIIIGHTAPSGSVFSEAFVLNPINQSCYSPARREVSVFREGDRREAEAPYIFILHYNHPTHYVELTRIVTIIIDGAASREVCLASASGSEDELR